jgi:hypothetical protein
MIKFQIANFSTRIVSAKEYFIFRLPQTLFLPFFFMVLKIDMHGFLGRNSLIMIDTESTILLFTI